MFAMGQNALRCAVAVGGRERNVVDDDTQIESGARAAESRKRRRSGAVSLYQRAPHRRRRPPTWRLARGLNKYLDESRA